MKEARDMVMEEKMKEARDMVMEEKMKEARDMVKLAKEVLAMGYPKKEVFKPSKLDGRSRQLIENTLRTVTKNTAPLLVKSIANTYINSAKELLSDHDGETFLYKFYKGNVELLERFVNDVGPNAGRFSRRGHSYKMKPNAKAIAAQLAEEKATIMMDQFILKNIEKIGPVMKLKGGLTDIDIINMGVSGPSIAANIKVSFNDGTSFVVRNKAVMKWNLRKTFFQFPTTFHDVVYPDGSTKSMVPEKSMNTDWAIAGK